MYATLATQPTQVVDELILRIVPGMILLLNPYVYGHGLSYFYPEGLSFSDRLAMLTPDLLQIRADYDWTDEDEDDGEMEPLTHNKCEIGPEVEGSSHEHDGLSLSSNRLSLSFLLFS